MFRRLLDWLRKQVFKIIPNRNIEDGLKVEVDLSDEMVSSIELWTKMYEDEAPWVDGKIIKSSNTAASVASEIARLVTIEIESEVTAGTDEDDNTLESDRADYLNEQYQRVVDNLRVQTEYAAAKGGVIFKPYQDGSRIAVDYVQADNFYPVEFNSSGDLIAVIFPEVIARDKKVYTRLEYHHFMLDKKIIYVSNTAYMRGEHQEGLGKEVGLDIIPEWADLEEEGNLTKAEKPLYSYFKMPLANNKDSRSHLGVSIYSKAENLIEEVDRQYSKILWEYDATEIAIDVNIDMLTNGELPEGKKRLYRKLDTEDESFHKVFNPDIRDQSLFNGLNELLRKVEFSVGLAYGTLSDVREAAKTATEIVSSKQRSYSTVVDIQKSLQEALEHLLYSMDYLTTFYKLAPKGEWEVSFHFDDSIIVNAKEEQAIMLNEVAAGLIRPEYYLMKRYGLEEEAAKELLPNMDTGIKEKDYDDME